MSIKIKICKWNACKKANSQYTMDRACDSLNIKTEDWWTTNNWKVKLEFWWCTWRCREAVNISIEKTSKEWKVLKSSIPKVDPAKMWLIMKEFKKYKNI